MPESLHRELVRKAQAEGVSLNQFACATLAVAVGWNPGPTSGDEESSTVTRSSSPGDQAFEKLWRELQG